MKRVAIVSLAFSLITAAGICFADDFAIIVNKSNPINVISRQDLKQVALGKKSEWQDGKKIYFVIQEGGVHDRFVKDILHKNSSQYANYWKMAIFTGTGTPPKSLRNDDEVKNIVAGRRDAIGYISTSAVDSTVKRIGVE